MAKDLSRIFGVWRRIFATFVLVTRQGSLIERKSGKDPKPVPKDPGKILGHTSNIPVAWLL